MVKSVTSDIRLRASTILIGACRALLGGFGQLVTVAAGPLLASFLWDTVLHWVSLGTQQFGWLGNILFGTVGLVVQTLFDAAFLARWYQVMLLGAPLPLISRAFVQRWARFLLAWLVINIVVALIGATLHDVLIWMTFKLASRLLLDVEQSRAVVFAQTMATRALITSLIACYGLLFPAIACGASDGWRAARRRLRGNYSNLAIAAVALTCATSALTFGLHDLAFPYHSFVGNEIIDLGSRFISNALLAAAFAVAYRAIALPPAKSEAIPLSALGGGEVG